MMFDWCKSYKGVRVTAAWYYSSFRCYSVLIISRLAAESAEAVVAAALGDEVEDSAVGHTCSSVFARHIADLIVCKSAESVVEDVLLCVCRDGDSLVGCGENGEDMTVLRVAYEFDVGVLFVKEEREAAAVRADEGVDSCHNNCGLLNC